jgi:hypothetical protein
LKLQRLQNWVFRASGTFDRHTLVREVHMASEISFAYDYITKFCMQQADVIQSHLYPNVHTNGQGETMHRNHKRLKFGGGQAYDRSSDWLPFRSGKIS